MLSILLSAPALSWSRSLGVLYLLTGQRVMLGVHRDAHHGLFWHRMSFQGLD